MPGFIKKHWKKILVSALAVLFVFQLTLPAFAQENEGILDKAGSLLPWNIGKTVTSKVTEAVLEAATLPITMMTWLARIMGGFILAQVTFILGFVIDLNFDILNTELATYKFIGVGWGIMRDIANLGFVLFIILIALATIIRYQEYEAKKLLPRLIMVAILVNFSLAIPTVFLNFSNVLTHYFLDRVGDPSAPIFEGGATGSVRFAYELVTIFKPQNFIITNPSQEDIAILAGPALGVGEGMLNFASSMTARFMNMIFLVLAILVIGTLAILFMVRFIMLSFLLVLGPVAWLTWVIPGLENNFKSWWKKFIQHTFFMPISIFFIYLVILTGDGFYAIAQNRETNLFTAEGISNIYKQQLMYGAAMLIISGFMLGAIFVGKKLSIEGAGKALNIGKSWSDKARKWAGQKTVESGKRAAAGPRGIALATRLQSSNNPLISRLGDFAYSKVGKWDKDFQKKADEKASILSDGNSETAGFLKNRAGFTSERMKAAYNNVIANDGSKLSKDEKDKKEAYEGATDTYQTMISRRLKAKQQLAEADQQYNNAVTKETGLKGEISANQSELAKIDADLQSIRRQLQFATGNTAPLKQQEAKLLADQAEKQKKAQELPKELEKLSSSIDGFKKAQQAAENNLQAKEDSYQKALEKRIEALKDYGKAKSAKQDFDLHVMSKLSHDERNQLKEAKFDLSKTTMAGSRQARGRQIPEIRTTKLQKEVNRLEKEFNNAVTELSRLQKAPSAKPEDISAAEAWKNKKEEEFNGSKVQLQKFRDVVKEWNDSKKEEDQYIKGGIPASDAKFAAIKKRVAEAEKSYWDTARGNLMKKPGYAPGVKGKGGKGKKDDDE